MYNYEAAKTAHWLVRRVKKKINLIFDFMEIIIFSIAKAVKKTFAR